MWSGIEHFIFKSLGVFMLMMGGGVRILKSNDLEGGVLPQTNCEKLSPSRTYLLNVFERSPFYIP